MPTKILLSGFLALLLYAHPVCAAPITDKDIQAIVNSLKYIHGLHQEKGTLVIVALYDPAIPDSRQDGERFIAQLASASPTKDGTTLKGQLLSVHDIPAHADISVAYISSGLSANYQAIGDLAVKQHFFTIGRERACVQTGCCILAIETAGAVNIYLNEHTLYAGGFDIDAAFKFMVKSV